MIFAFLGHVQNEEGNCEISQEHLGVNYLFIWKILVDYDTKVRLL